MRLYFDGFLYSWIKDGGVVRYYSEIFKCLGKESEVNVIFHQPHYEVEIPETIKSLNLFNKPALLNSLPLRWQRLILKPISHLLAKRFFSKISDGVFHSTYYTTYSGLKIPQVTTVHDMNYEKFPEYFKSFGAKRFIKQKEKSVRAADHIICISETTKKDVMEYYDINDKKISVIYHGVNDSFKKLDEGLVKKSLNDNYSLTDSYILFVGKRGLYKNFDIVLEAFAAWEKNKDYKLVVVGDTWNKVEIKQIQKLGIQERVENLGFVPDNDLVNLYNRASVFTFPSLYEGFGLPLLEAACCGTRVVAADNPVFREIADKWATFFTPNSPQSLIKAWETSLRSEVPGIYSEVKNSFSWEKTAELTKKIYKDVSQQYYDNR